MMRVGEICLRSLASLVVILSLAGAPGRSSAQQTPKKESAHRIWTNDDFPSGQAVQPSPRDEEVRPTAAPKDRPKVEPKSESNKSKDDPWSPPDPASRNYKEMPPEQRQALVDEDEQEIVRVKKKITDIQAVIPRLPPEAYETTRGELLLIKRLNRFIEGLDTEIKTLRSFPQRGSPQKDSGDSPGGDVAPRTTPQ